MAGPTSLFVPRGLYVDLASLLVGSDRVCWQDTRMYRYHRLAVQDLLTVHLWRHEPRFTLEYVIMTVDVHKALSLLLQGSSFFAAQNFLLSSAAQGEPTFCVPGEGALSGGEPFFWAKVFSRDSQEAEP